MGGRALVSRLFDCFKLQEIIMKTVQKLEVFFGLATLVAAFVGFYKEDMSLLIDTNFDVNRGELLMRTGLFYFYRQF